jgi:Ca-activated chloride channel family protein
VSEVLSLLGIDGWARPALIVPLALALLAFVLWRRHKGSEALAWSEFDEARSAGARRFDGVTWLASAARVAALAALGLVLVGPLGVHRAPPEPGLGLDMTLVVDASGSMRAIDAQGGGSTRSRIDLAREVVARFATERAAEGDRVALVVFGERAFTQCPLTSDGGVLAAALDRVEAGMAGEATALGQALALAVKRAAGADAQVAAAGTPTAGRVVVLLTDGRHNAGALSPEVATELARATGVRVHAVAIGSEGEAVPVAGPSGAIRYERHEVDAEMLARVAETTGGRFFRARRSADLAAVYAAIDELERIERPRPPQVRRVARPEPLLAAAGVFLLFEIGVARTWRRRLT